MSRSTPTLTNPAKRFFRWSGGKGELTYWDKEQSEEISVPLPFTFLVLDELATITGFCEQDASGYWSNEVRSVAREELTVRTSKGVKQTGFYKDLTDVRSKGAKYAKSIYVAYFDEDENGLAIGNLKASGAALTAWIEFGNKNVAELGKITLSGSEKAKKGATTYFIPQFSWTNADTSEDEIAKELDSELQQYLTAYKSQNEETFSDGSPIPDEVIEHFDEGEPINLDDIPFR